MDKIWKEHTQLNKQKENLITKHENVQEQMRKVVLKAFDLSKLPSLIMWKDTTGIEYLVKTNRVKAHPSGVTVIYEREGLDKWRDIYIHYRNGEFVIEEDKHIKRLYKDME